MFKFFMSYIVLNDMFMKPFGCGISVYLKLVEVIWLYWYVRDFKKAVKNPQKQELLCVVLWGNSFQDILCCVNPIANKLY